MHKYKGPQTATPTTISTDLGCLAALALALPTRTRRIYCILYKTCFYKGFSVFSIKCKEMNGLPFITPLLNSRFICLFFALVLHTTMRKIFCIKCWQLYGCQPPFTGKNLGVVSSWMDRYPTNIGNDFCYFFLFLPTTTGRIFCILLIVSRCTTCYLTTIGKDFLLFIYSVTSNKAKMQKYGTCPPSVRVAFSKTSNLC